MPKGFIDIVREPGVSLPGSCFGRLFTRGPNVRICTTVSKSRTLDNISQPSGALKGTLQLSHNTISYCLSPNQYIYVPLHWLLL